MTPVPTQEMLLSVQGLTCRFGGLTAVDDLTFSIASGVVSLIGPNGAGKTTVFNCISGIVRSTSGLIRLRDRDITGWPIHAVMAAGVARTFQGIRLFNQMTVLENAMAGQHTRTTSGLVAAIVRTRYQREEERAVEREALEAIRFVGLTANVNQLSGTLDYGEKRRLEIARALASKPQVLLLDEPAAGMNAPETDVLVDVINRLRSRGVTILLIEHQMSLVMGISDRVLVLDQGRLIADGAPDEVRLDERVLAAYLGTETEDVP